MIMPHAETKRRIDDLKNFGFHDEVTVVAPGINSKMDEMRAAYGLLNLRYVDAAIAARKEVARKYVQALQGVPGITLFECEKQLLLSEQDYEWNCSYFPILVDAEQYGMSRDDLYAKMRAQNVLGRRYFYPLISEFSTYRGLPSAAKENLPNAHRLASQVICLPMHHGLTEEDVQRVVECLKSAV